MSYGAAQGNRKLSKEIKAMSLLSTIIGRIGLIDTKKIKAQIENIETTMKELVGDIDKANKYLGKQGRASIASLNIDIAKNAISAYQSGDVKSGDSILMDEIERMIPLFKMKMFNRVPAFKIREELILLALKDHEEKRYHASIPVLLACIDGVGNDMTPDQKGLFAEGDHIELENSVTGYKEGLPAVIKIISQTRRKTNTSSIDIPYRNGILHGHDINYYNPLVAAKTISLLFATYDWAIDIIKKKEEENKIKQEESKGFRDSMIQYSQMQQKYKNQEIEVGKRNPRTLEQINSILKHKTIEYGSPEKVVLDRIEYIQKGNFGKAVQLKSNFNKRKKSINLYAGELKKRLCNIEILGCEIKSIKDEAPAITEIEFILSYNADGVQQEKEIKQRLLYEDENGEVLPSNMDGGNWRMIFDIEDLLDIY